MFLQMIGSLDLWITLNMEIFLLNAWFLFIVWWYECLNLKIFSLNVLTVWIIFEIFEFELQFQRIIWEANDEFFHIQLSSHGLTNPKTIECEGIHLKYNTQLF